MEPLKSAPYIVHSAVYSVSVFFLDQRKYSEKSEFYMFRPMYSKQVFIIWTLFGLIRLFNGCLVEIEITVYFLWLLLRVHLASL